MPLEPGTKLGPYESQKLAGTALRTRKAIEYTGQITQGLAAAHRKGSSIAN
jgi:hypothetical protein